MKASPEEIAHYTRLALERGGQVISTGGRAEVPHCVTATKITEKQFQVVVLDLARECGWRSAHFRPGRNARGTWMTAVAGDGKGFPDNVFVRERLVFAELKVPPNKLEPDQELWLEALRAAKIEAYLWVPEDFAEIVRILR